MNRREAIAALVALPASVSISKTEVTSADTIVVECDQFLSNQETQRMDEILKSVWPTSKVVVLDRGIKLKVLRQS